MSRTKHLRAGRKAKRNWRAETYVPVTRKKPRDRRRRKRSRDRPSGEEVCQGEVSVCRFDVSRPLNQGALDGLIQIEEHDSLPTRKAK